MDGAASCFNPTPIEELAGISHVVWDFVCAGRVACRWKARDAPLC